MKIIFVMILIIIFTLLTIPDVPRLWRSKLYKDLIFYLSFWSLSLVIAILLVYEVKVPSPAKVITRILEPYLPKMSVP